jgi:hypothetical protein
MTLFERLMARSTTPAPSSRFLRHGATHHGHGPNMMIAMPDAATRKPTTSHVVGAHTVDQS